MRPPAASARHWGWEMTECRFYPECSHLLDVEDSWFPCTGGADGRRCSEYSPIPYAEALLELADEMDRVADENRLTGMMAIGRARAWADRIREALNPGERER